jgi:hypothetical protein
MKILASVDFTEVCYFSNLLLKFQYHLFDTLPEMEWNAHHFRYGSKLSAFCSLQE